MLFVLFAVLHHLINWSIRLSNKNSDGLGIIAATFLTFVSIVLAVIIYHGSYEVKEELVRDPCQYQMTASDSGYTFYDYDRRVGFIPTGNSKLDTLIWNDNL